MKSKIIRHLRYSLEAIVVFIVLGIFRLMPVQCASWIGGNLARWIGPWLGAHKVGRRNLKHIYPSLDDDACEKILKETWENLGRVAGEFPHLHSLVRDQKRVTWEGLEHLEKVPSYNGVLFFSIHSANWELASTGLGAHDIPVHIVGRDPNNPFVAALVKKLRSAHNIALLSKGRDGARQLLKLIFAGQNIGLLIDQKANDGIEVNFLGHKAMAAPALARFALRSQHPVVPIQVIRTQGCHFKIICHPPIFPSSQGDTPEAVQMFMQELYTLIGIWIQEHPGQWLWLHRRWPN